MSEQLSLLDWKPPAEVLPFPLHRSHGSTIAVARSIVSLETSKRSGKLNSIRAQTRKRLEPLIGLDCADKAANDLIRMIKIGFAYCEPPSSCRQKSSATVISLLSEKQMRPGRLVNSADEGGASGQGAKLLAGVGGAHDSTEYDAARETMRVGGDL